MSFKDALPGMLVGQSTINRLVAWGDWSRTDRIKPRYGSTLGSLSGSSFNVQNYDLSEVEQIDRIVSRLRFQNRAMGLVVNLYYAEKKDFRLIGEILGMTKDRARSLKLTGEAWIDGAINVSIERRA